MKHTRVTVVGAVLLLLCAGVLSISWPSSEPFSTEKWMHATPQMRDRLMDSLAKNRTLIGLTEAEVLAMLGDPDGASHGQAMYYFRREGRSRPCLIFRFTRDGYVKSRRLSSMGGTVSRAKFEAPIWRMGTPADRLSMVRDLIASQSLEGMHRGELYRLLGNPDRETSTGPRIWYCQRYYGDKGEVKKRYAGASKCLYIRFRDGIVEDAEFTGS